MSDGNNIAKPDMPNAVENNLRDRQTVSLQVKRRWIIGLTIAMVAGAMVVVPAVYRRYRVTAGLSPDSIASIQIHPNGDWPVLSLDSKEEIAKFVGWLKTTRDASDLRSAPPPVVFDGSIHFRNGHTESFRTSAILPPKSDKNNSDWTTPCDRQLLSPRSDVRIEFRGIMQVGNRSLLVRAIETKR